MNAQRTLLGLGLVTALLFGALTINAQEKSDKKEPKAKGLPYAGKVIAVDKGASTVTLGSKEKNRIYQINAQTRISKGGKPAMIEDAVVGEEAAVYGAQVDGKYVAQSLRLGAKPEDDGKAKIEAKSKKKKDADKQ